jgi:beta-xylosidase
VLASLLLMLGPASAQAGVLLLAKDAPSRRPCASGHTQRTGNGRRRACRPVAKRPRAKAAKPAPAQPISVTAGPYYQNPVSGEAPDPSSFSSGATYYLYSTGDGFPIERSTDLVHWTPDGTAFAQRPAWVVQSGDWHPWAPDVVHAQVPCPLNTVVPSLLGRLQLGLTCFYMYYVGLSALYDLNCVAVATSVTPDGPFVDQGPLWNGTLDAAGRPIGCADDGGMGNIDPSVFIDGDGQAYLYVSTDFACANGVAPCTAAGSSLQPTIAVMRLAPDLLSVVGARVPLFAGDQPWQQGPAAKVVEGPSVQRRNGVYTLFYSGGGWAGHYAMGDAQLASPLGPVSQDPANPILSGTGNVLNPGGGTPVIGPHGGDWMLYHASLRGQGGARYLFIDPIGWGADGRPRIFGPTTTPEAPVP